jgi:hypothetical protein
MRKIIALTALILSTTAIADDRVTVSGLQAGMHDLGYPAVFGIAHNNSNETLRSVFVKFKLYDSAGNVVGNTVANGQDIGPGENWKFSAAATQPFSTMKLSEVTIY